MEIKKNNPLLNNINNTSNKNKLILKTVIILVFIFIFLFLSIWFLYKINEMTKKINLLSKLDTSQNTSNINIQNNNDVSDLESLKKLEPYLKDSTSCRELIKINEELNKYQENEKNDKKNRDIFEKALRLFDSKSSNADSEENLIDLFQENREQQELIKVIKGFIKCCEMLEDFKNTLNSNITYLSLNKLEDMKHNHVQGLTNDIASGRKWLNFYANLLNTLIIHNEEIQQKIISSSPYEKLILKSMDNQYNLLFKEIRKVIRGVSSSNQGNMPKRFSKLF